MPKLRFVGKVWERAEEEFLESLSRHLLMFLNLLVKFIIIILDILLAYGVHRAIKFLSASETETLELVDMIFSLFILLIVVIHLVDGVHIITSKNKGR